MKKPYSCNLTKIEIEETLHKYFDLKKTGSIVKISWLIKNEPAYVLSFLKENYPEYSEINDCYQYLYRIKYPDSIKICNVCGKPLTSFSFKKGYYGGLSHRLCNKSWQKYQLIQFMIF